MKSNSILFGTPPLKAQNHKICQTLPPWLHLCWSYDKFEMHD